MSVAMSKCRKERAVALSVVRTAFDSGFSAAPSMPAGAAALWHLRPREEPRVLPASLRAGRWPDKGAHRRV